VAAELEAVDAIASVEHVSESCIHLRCGLGPPPDEFVVAELVRSLDRPSARA
jgi:hypothetical protein